MPSLCTTLLEDDAARRAGSAWDCKVRLPVRLVSGSSISPASVTYESYGSRRFLRARHLNFGGSGQNIVGLDSAYADKGTRGREGLFPKTLRSFCNLGLAPRFQTGRLAKDGQTNQHAIIQTANTSASIIHSIWTSPSFLFHCLGEGKGKEEGRGGREMGEGRKREGGGTGGLSDAQCRTAAWPIANRPAASPAAKSTTRSRTDETCLTPSDFPSRGLRVKISALRLYWSVHPASA